MKVTSRKDELHESLSKKALRSGTRGTRPSEERLGFATAALRFAALTLCSLCTLVAKSR